jgi:hypothetical protein
MLVTNVEKLNGNGEFEIYLKGNFNVSYEFNVWRRGWGPALKNGPSVAGGGVHATRAWGGRQAGLASGRERELVCGAWAIVSRASFS